ncbi:Pentatricopeptide repeat-containing protein [Acorus calamus]|uniref:Pentatricopeptide repeat-containing protein n=1 Tax=Acorus calamus TaxID=4465 RepID=A0AAV9DS54_ACOCL|nr:Pentatricopeptide repeat-containing protein [Acorus calamus]
MGGYLKTYIDFPTPSQGQKIHSHLIKSGLRPNTNMSIKLQILYIKCGMLDQIPHPLSAYNFMISAYIKQCRTDDSLALLRKLAFSDEKPDGEVHTQIVKCGCESDDVLSTALVDSYAKNARVGYARLVLDEMSRRNVVCATAMITGYMNQGSVGDAEEIFNRTAEKDVVVFNAIIEGYSRTAETAMRALEVYDSMRGLGFSPTVSTFSSVVGACSVLAAFDFATQVHAQLVKFNALANVKPASALVDTYCKCGKIGEARALFDRMVEWNVFSWTSMIDGYRRNGVPREALRLFEQMRKTKKVRPRMGDAGESGFGCVGSFVGGGEGAWGCRDGKFGGAGDVRGGERGAGGGLCCVVEHAGGGGEWEGVREMMVERGLAKNSGQSWIGADEGLRDFGVGDQNRGCAFVVKAFALT